MCRRTPAFTASGLANARSASSSAITDFEIAFWAAASCRQSREVDRVQARFKKRRDVDDGSNDVCVYVEPEELRIFIHCVKDCGPGFRSLVNEPNIEKYPSALDQVCGRLKSLIEG